MSGSSVHERTPTASSPPWRNSGSIVGRSRVPVISLADLKANKRASGRPQDLADLEHLP
jgi:hypothetical protein